MIFGYHDNGFYEKNQAQGGSYRPLTHGEILDIFEECYE